MGQDFTNRALKPITGGDTGSLILKTYGMEALRVAQYGAGVSAVIARNQVKSPSNPYTKMEPVQKDAPLYKSVLGTLFFCNFEIQGGSWTDDNGVVTNFGGVIFDTVLMAVDLQKVIVKTVVQGRNGTVKEYITNGDYLINIKLLIIGANGVMPLDEVSELKKALDAPVALAVNSRYLQNLGIYNIVVDDYSMPQIEGGYNMQQVEIRACSDEPIELIIK